MGRGGEAQASICRAAERIGVRAWGGKAGEILGEDHGARLREEGDDSDRGAGVSASERASRSRAEQRVGVVVRNEAGRAASWAEGCARAGTRAGLRSAGRRGEREWLGRVGSERAARFGVGKRRVGHGPLRVGLGWVVGVGPKPGLGSFLFLFLLPFSFSNYTQTNLNSNQI